MKEFYMHTAVKMTETKSIALIEIYSLKIKIFALSFHLDHLNE
jgi:hypothetical protein